MKHLPNLLTLCNLIAGCIAIAFILDSQPFQVMINGDYYYVTGTEQAYLGAVFIGIAAICDLLDGFAARALRIHSPIGKDLDSLADVVSFGVAPAMILFKMLWACWMMEEGALDIPMLAMAPAFLIAAFAALRLARFNTLPARPDGRFTGLPVPATGMLVASFPLINFYNPYGIGVYLQNQWTLYLIIGLLCWLMVSRIPFFKLLPPQRSLAAAWPQLTLAVVTLALIPFLKIAVIPVAFGLYMLLSLVSRPGESAADEKGAV